MATRKAPETQADACPPPSPSLTPSFQLLPDPFQIAISKSRTPAGHLGKGSPASLARIAAQLGKPIARFKIGDYRDAMELMGYWVDTLTAELEVERRAALAKLLPAKRGRPPKPRPILPRGLLPVINASSKGGRPVEWSDDMKHLLADLVDNIKAEFGLRSYEAAINKLIAMIAESQGKSPRSTFTKPVSTVKCMLRNVAERGRRLRSKPA